MGSPRELHGHFDVALVVLSVAIAIVASYASLDQARRASQAHGGTRLLWLAGGGLTMGFGIWSMHFVAMLSFKMAMPVSYQPGLVALSLVAAVAGASIALAVVTRERPSRSGLLTGSAYMGFAVAAMHYLGMDSMQMAASISWNGWLVALSVGVGLAASLLALLLVVRITAQRGPLRPEYHVAAAILLGFGVAGLHYIGMAAATFYSSAASAPGGFTTSSLVTTLGIAGGVAFLALLCVVVVDQRRADLAVDLALVAGLVRQLAHGEAVREELCVTAQRLTGADHVGLYEPDAEGRLRLAASCGSAEPVPEPAGAPERERQVLRDGERLFVPGERRGTRRQRDPEALCGSAHYEPLTLDGRTLALLKLCWQRRVRALPQRTTALLGMLASDAVVLLDRHDLLARLEYLAHRDELTGLANRRVLGEELERAITAAAGSLRPVSVIMIDFDHFKRCNDTLGHQAGDRLLMGAAAAWSAMLRGSDTVARLGGDEFAVVLPECPHERAIEVAEQLRTGVPAGASCSAGVATWDFSETPGHLLHRADQALYAAKAAGRERTGSSIRHLA